MDYQSLGRAVQPAMEQLRERIPHLTAAILCTPDGLNICSLGVDQKQVDKMAALSGSLLSVGNATMKELRGNLEEHSMDLLAIRTEAFKLLGIKIPTPSNNCQLSLMVAATDALGLMIVGAEYVASEIEKLCA
jgi:predicted regulator of Ras-like GTPase activity (Roadblock/LC7/MglB family)